MTEKTPEKTPVEAAERIPVLPLRDVVVYPHMVIPLFVGREKSIVALDEAMNRDKRILLLGIIAEKGEPMTFKIQIKASLKRGEINPEEAREFLLFVAQYSGYPRAASMLGPVEEAIAEYETEKAAADSE